MSFGYKANKVQPVENIIPPPPPQFKSRLGHTDARLQNSKSNGSFPLGPACKTERFRLSSRLNDLLRWMLWQTFSRLVSGRGVTGQFPDTEGLMQTGHHLCGPLCLLSIGSSVSHVSLSSFHLSWLSPSLHHGTSKWFNSPALSASPSRFSHPPPSFRPCLFGNASKLTGSPSVSRHSIHLSRRVCLKGPQWYAVPSQVHRFG